MLAQLSKGGLKLAKDTLKRDKNKALETQDSFEGRIDHNIKALKKVLNFSTFSLWNILRN